MRAKFINESFVSKFRPKMKVITKDNEYYIQKVEEHSYKFDILTVIDKNGKKKLVASDWMEQNGTIVTSEKQKIKSLTTQEYTRELKDAINGLKQTMKDVEGLGPDIDSAESMLYDESLYNYVYRKYKRMWDNVTPKKRELIELLVNDMSNIY